MNLFLGLRYFSVQQAAKSLKLSQQRVRVLLARGYLPGFRLPVGGREVWHVHPSLRRRPAKAGRPVKKARRQAVRGCEGEAAA